MIMYEKEEEEKWLPQKLLRIEELVIYLTKLNDNIMVYVRKITINAKDGIKIYEMSNGISYSKNTEGRWFITG